jgi:hypothetical protein
MELSFLRGYTKLFVGDDALQYKSLLQKPKAIPYSDLILAVSVGNKLQLLEKNGKVDSFNSADADSNTLEAAVAAIQQKIIAASAEEPPTDYLFRTIGSQLLISGMFCGTEENCYFITPQSTKPISDYRKLIRVQAEDATISFLNAEGDVEKVRLLNSTMAGNIAGIIHECVETIHREDPDYQNLVSGLVYYGECTSSGQPAVCKIDNSSIQILCGKGRIRSMRFHNLAAVDLKTVAAYSNIGGSIMDTLSKYVTDVTRKEALAIVCMDTEGRSLSFSVEPEKMQQVYGILDKTAAKAWQQDSARETNWKFLASATYQSREVLLRADKSHIDLIKDGTVLKSVLFTNLSEFKRSESAYTFRTFTEEQPFTVKVSKTRASIGESILKTLISSAHKGDAEYNSNKQRQLEQDSLESAIAEHSIEIMDNAQVRVLFVPTIGSFAYKRPDMMHYEKILSGDITALNAFALNNRNIIRLTCRGEDGDIRYIDFDDGDAALEDEVDHANKAYERIRNFIDLYQSNYRSSEDSSSSKDGGYTQFFSGCKTQKDLKARYRSLAKLYHPDNNGGTNEAFAVIEEEYQSLLNILPEE